METDVVTQEELLQEAATTKKGRGRPPGKNKADTKPRPKKTAENDTSNDTQHTDIVLSLSQRRKLEEYVAITESAGISEGGRKLLVMAMRLLDTLKESPNSVLGIWDLDKHPDDPEYVKMKIRVDSLIS